MFRQPALPRLNGLVSSNAAWIEYQIAAPTRPRPVPGFPSQKLENLRTDMTDYRLSGPRGDSNDRSILFFAKSGHRVEI